VSAGVLGAIQWGRGPLIGLSEGSLSSARDLALNKVFLFLKLLCWVS
jgi:hypothetical protein